MDTINPLKLSFTHLPQGTLDAFKVLSEQSWLREGGWYLAGGTALALQFGHRESLDLDFFTQNPDFEMEPIISKLSDNQWTTSLREKGTLYGELKGVKVSFIAYPYFIPKQPFIPYNDLNIADAKDLAVMKIIAVSQRGKKRDFFDIYWYLINKEPLIDVLNRLNSQYPNLKHNFHHILKSLTYFEEAEEDPDPKIFFDATWEQVKKHFLVVVPKTAKELLV